MDLIVQEFIPNKATPVSIQKKGFTSVTNLDANTGYIYIGDAFLTSSKYLTRLNAGEVFIMEHSEDLTFYILNSVSGEKCEVSTWV
jgi:hypothetical protein